MVTMATDGVDQGTDVTDVSPELLEQWLASGEAVLVDVREDYEHAEERIGGSKLEPLSKFDADRVREWSGGKRVVFHCRSGKRSLDAANRYRSGDEPLFHLAGGILGWIEAGKGTVKPAKAPKIPVMRQVQITAGSLVVLGVALGTTVSPWFLGISGFVGAGLVFAGVTGWCGMANVLAVMPWNKAAVKGACAT